LEASEKTAAAAADKALAEQKVAADALAKKQEQATLVANAAARTNVAVKKIPDDQAVAQAFTLLDERSKALTAEIAAATTAAADLAAKGAPLVEQAKLAHEAVAAARGKLPTDQSRALDQAVFDATHQTADARFVVASLNGQIATGQVLVQYNELAKTDPVKAEAAWNALIERWTINNQIGALRPLSPEQLATSAMRATGFLTPQEASAVAAIDSKPPEVLTKAVDADKPRIRAEQIELRLIDQLDKTFAEFAKLYGGESGQDFQASVNQSLYFGNGAAVDSWLKAGGESLAVRLGKLEDPAALSDELYVAVFTRPATDAEKQDVTDFLKDRTADRPVAIGELIWALLSATIPLPLAPSPGAAPCSAAIL
jgi:hypothetical protein